MAVTKFLSTDCVADLIKSAEGTCVSIFLPTHRSGRETLQGPIHLKNQLREASNSLVAQGVSSSDAAEYLKPLSAYLDDSEFWQHQADGLALFHCQGLTEAFRLPINVPVRTVVSDSFDVTPLLPMVSIEGRFFILAVSENDVRLLDATRFSFYEVDVEGMPKSMAEALFADDKEQQINYHSGAGSSPKGGGRSAMYFGTGDDGSKEQHKTDCKRYFDKLDNSLSAILKQNPHPVVLAGVGYLLPIYKAANRSAMIIGEVHGSPDRATAEALHAEAWVTAESFFTKSIDESLEAFREAHGTGLASGTLHKITAAAAEGRVKELFVDLDRLALQEESLIDVNRAVSETLLKKGQIHVVGQGVLPDDAVAAAIFRY